ncbi:hypothetical protein ACFPRL_13550 [Pseudoclavibacter helvolus]
MRCTEASGTHPTQPSSVGPATAAVVPTPTSPTVRIAAPSPVRNRERGGRRSVATARAIKRASVAFLGSDPSAGGALRRIRSSISSMSAMSSLLSGCPSLRICPDAPHS